MTAAIISAIFCMYIFLTGIYIKYLSDELKETKKRCEILYKRYQDESTISNELYNKRLKERMNHATLNDKYDKLLKKYNQINNSKDKITKLKLRVLHSKPIPRD
jgi:hypothetical protein